MADISKITTLDGTTYNIKDETARTVMTGATSEAGGAAGLVPAPTASDISKFLKGDGTWGAGGQPMVVLSYGNSTWNDFINAYNNNVIVYCKASSGSNPASGAQTRMAFMAYVNASPPTEVEFQYYRSVSSHTATQQGDQVFIYKLTSSGTWTVTTREAATKIVAGTNMTSTYSSGTLTLKANQTDKADKTDTVLETTLSRGRASGSTVGAGSIAFGSGATASGGYSQAVGQNPTASGSMSHAEGDHTTASASCAHAEGSYTSAQGYYSHAEGINTVASGTATHAGGTCTIAQRGSQVAIGRYNVADTQGTSNQEGKYVEIVGNGNSDSNRSNARAVDWDGNEYISGTLYVNCDSTSSNGVEVPTVLTPSSAFSIPSSGDSVTYNMTGITSGHQLVRWNFSSSAENNPPASLTWSTTDGRFTITNVGGTTDETIQPVFVKATSVAITEYTE